MCLYQYSMPLLNSELQSFSLISLTCVSFNSHAKNSSFIARNDGISYT